MPEQELKQDELQQLKARAISQPLVEHIYTADPSAHVFNGRLYVYPSHDIEAGIAFVEELAGELGVPGLSAYGMGSADIADIAEKAAAASSMKGNPIALSSAELEDILERAL